MGTEVKSVLLENNNKSIPIVELQNDIYLVEYKVNGSVSRTRVVKN